MSILGEANTTSTYSKLRWLLILVIAMHNFEEWLTFPIYGEGAGTIANRLGLPFQPPSWAAIQLALLLVTLLPALIIIWASLGEQHKWKDMAVCFVAGIFSPMYSFPTYRRRFFPMHTRPAS